MCKVKVYTVYLSDLDGCILCAILISNLREETWKEAWKMLGTEGDVW